MGTFNMQVYEYLSSLKSQIWKTSNTDKSVSKCFIVTTLIKTLL